MRSKRGGTLAVEEIVKLVIGIGVFILILFILFALGKIVASNLKEEQARNTLDNIVYEVGKMAVGQTKEVLIESPKDWAILSNGSKLCFCEEKVLGFFSFETNRDEYFAKCSSKNICYSFLQPVNVTSYCNSAENGKGSFWYSRDVAWGKTLKNCLYISSVPKAIYLFKGTDELFVGISSFGSSKDSFNSEKWFGETYTLYTVVKGDTLGSIAERNKVNLGDILFLENGKSAISATLLEGRVTNPNVLSIGQKIRIPDYSNSAT